MTARDETAAPAFAVPMDAAALVAGLVTVTAWGSAFVGIRSAGAALSPGSLALGRLLVSTAILGSVALVRRDRRFLAIGQEPPGGQWAERRARRALNFARIDVHRVVTSGQMASALDVRSNCQR